MRLLRQEPALVLVPAGTPAVRIEARRSGPQSVLFAHGERTHVLGAASERAVLELHAVAGAHVVVCVDRSSLATAKIRIWASRDRGASWTVDRSFDISSLGPRTRLMREA